MPETREPLQQSPEPISGSKVAMRRIWLAVSAAERAWERSLEQSNYCQSRRYCLEDAARSSETTQEMNVSWLAQFSGCRAIIGCSRMDVRRMFTRSAGLGPGSNQDEHINVRRSSSVSYMRRLVPGVMHQRHQPAGSSRTGCEPSPIVFTFHSPRTARATGDPQQESEHLSGRCNVLDSL